MFSWFRNSTYDHCSAVWKGRGDRSMRPPVLAPGSDICLPLLQTDGLVIGSVLIGLPTGIACPVWKRVRLLARALCFEVATRRTDEPHLRVNRTAPGVVICLSLHQTGVLVVGRIQVGLPIGVACPGRKRGRLARALCVDVATGRQICTQSDLG